MATRSRKTATRARPATRAAKTAAQKARSRSGPGAVAWASSGLKSAADQLLDWAGAATELSLGVGKSLVRDPKRQQALERAGAFLRDAREAAGLTVDDVARAMKLDDPGLIDRVESGRAALPFEALLRFAALVARNDPLPFAMKVARGYNPELWRSLEELGIGRLATQVGREREIVNIYRSRDAARKLTDAEFARVRDFTAAAFDLALGHIEDSRGRKPRS
jgi:transcriptional regulator with XRE-family HTH domain